MEHRRVNQSIFRRCFFNGCKKADEHSLRHYRELRAGRRSPNRKSINIRAVLAPTQRRRTMKYICLGYLEPGKFEGMTEDERHAGLDDCFEYNDHLRASGHLVAQVPLQP